MTTTPSTTAVLGDDFTPPAFGSATQCVVVFHNLDRFTGDRIQIEITKLSVIVGPNGSGKSTILEATAIILAAAKQYKSGCTYDDVYALFPPIEHRTRPRFDRAEIWVRRKNVEDEQSSQGLVGVAFKTDGEAIFLSDIYAEGKPSLHCAWSEVPTANRLTSEMRRRSKTLAQKILEYDLIAKALKPHAALSAWAVRYEEKKKIAESEQAQIHQRINTNHGQLAIDGKDVPLAEIEQMVEQVGLPDVRYLYGNQALSHHIDELVNEFHGLRDAPGHDYDGSPYQNLKAELSGFLEIAVLPTGGQSNPFKLLIGNCPIDQISTGTYLCLAFFALERQVPSGGIVIWDEPENSMHPTRRTKVRELAIKSKLGFIIATHQTEFVPFFDESSAIYKTASLYKANVGRSDFATARPECRIGRLTGTKVAEAFGVAQDLGVEPSRSLFTANVIIWVEGPSDLVYWRFWLARRATALHKRLLEGFDYSFMIYGGAQLASHRAKDEPGHHHQHESMNELSSLSVVATSIYLCDTDFDFVKVGRKECVADADGNVDAWREAGQRELQLFDPLDPVQVDRVRTHLKPRVQSLLRDSDQLSEGGASVIVQLTSGREIENDLTDECLRGLLAHVNHLDPESVERGLVDKLTVGRWDAFDEELELIVAAHGDSSTRLHKRPRNRASQAKLKTNACDKLAIAKTYVSLNWDTSPEQLKITLRHEWKYVDRVLEIIEGNRAKYR